MSIRARLKRLEQERRARCLGERGLYLPDYPEMSEAEWIAEYCVRPEPKRPPGT